MIPEGRTTEYAIWRACERFGVRPPGVEPGWDDCNVAARASIVAFDQIRQTEEIKEKAALAGVRM